MIWQTILNMSYDILGERLRSGNFSSSIDGYKVQAPALATLVQSELLPACGGQTPVPVAALTDRVLLPDSVALSAAPWGLAALLAIRDDPAVAAHCQARYEEARRRIPARAQRITDVYGIGGT